MPDVSLGRKDDGTLDEVRLDDEGKVRTTAEVSGPLGGPVAVEIVGGQATFAAVPEGGSGIPVRTVSEGAIDAIDAQTEQTVTEIRDLALDLADVATTGKQDEGIAATQAVEDAVDELEDDADRTRIAAEFLADPYHWTSFGQLRVAQREVLFENVQTYALDARAWATRTVGAGSVSYSSTTGMTAITVSAASGDIAELSSHTHLPYEPGATSHKVLTLRHSDAGQAGQRREWGFGTLDDGFIFRLDGTTLQIVRRSSCSGVATDEDVIDRDDWNGDKLDGFGPSGKTLDLTKINQWEPDYQWLSAGVVRFWINGILVHTLDLRGVLSLPATRTGQLPVRMTVENTGASSAATMHYVCSVVYRDGGTPTRYVPGSHVMSAPKTGIGTSFTPVIGFRLASTISGRPNRTITLPERARFSNASGRGVVRLILNPSSITGATWSQVSNAPWMEVSEDLTAVTGGTTLSEAYLPISTDARQLDGADVFRLNGIHLRRLADNSDGDVVVFLAKADSGNIDIVSMFVSFLRLG